MGYDFAPGALAGALAVSEAGADAVRVDVGYYALGAGPSSLSDGTRASLVGVTLGEGHAFRDGPGAWRPPGRARALVRGGGPSASGDLGRRRRALRAAGVVSAVARGQRLSRVVRAAGPADAGGVVRRAVRACGCRFRARFCGSPGSGRWGWSAGRRPGRRRAGGPGSRLRRTTARGANCPRSTSRGSTATSSRRRSWPGRRGSRSSGGAGALGPVEAYGLSQLVEGARVAGLERVR